MTSLDCTTSSWVSRATLKEAVPDALMLSEAETDAEETSETGVHVSSSGSDQGIIEDCWQGSSPAHTTCEQRELSMAAPSQTAATLLQLCSTGRACEILELTLAEVHQPCWLALSTDGYTIVQPTGQEIAQVYTCGDGLQCPLLRHSHRSLPPAPPPGLPASSLGCLRQGQGVVVQSGEPDVKHSLKCLAAAPSPQLTCTWSTGTTAKVAWAVDVKRFRSKDRMLVSPAFELPSGGHMLFRMMVQPADTPHGRGSVSFDRSHGRGSIQLKCEGSFEENATSSFIVKFKLSVGRKAWRGPVIHDFAQASVANLPSACCDWNFRSAVDASQRVTMSLEVECA